LIDPQTATDVGHAITTMDWKGIIVILLALIPFYLKLFFPSKDKEEKQPLTKADLDSIVSICKPTTCLFDKKIMEEVSDRIIENKDLLRDVLNQMKTDSGTADRVEDNVERVRKNLADLVESLRKNMR
jgi:hypothetical protein